MRKVLGILCMVLLLSLLVVTQSGCLVAAVGAATGGTLLYTNGELSETVVARPQQVIAATNAAMKELEMPVLTSSADGMEGHLEAALGTDNKVNVKVKSTGEKTSKIDIRIGTFGDENRSRQIMEKIKDQLKKAGVADKVA